MDGEERDHRRVEGIGDRIRAQRLRGEERAGGHGVGPLAVAQEARREEEGERQVERRVVLNPD